MVHGYKLSKAPRQQATAHKQRHHKQHDYTLSGLSWLLMLYLRVGISCTVALFSRRVDLKATLCSHPAHRHRLLLSYKQIEICLHSSCTAYRCLLAGSPCCFNIPTLCRRRGARFAHYDDLLANRLSNAFVDLRYKLCKLCLQR